MPRRGSTTPVRLWSDGIHYVRPASIKDRHPMRFVIGAHEKTASTFSRHMPDKESAIERGREATTAWLKRNPQDRPHWTEAPLPEASSTLEISATPKPTLQPFSTTHFNCITANPVAQVWQCVSREGERKSPGRPTKEGKAARAAAITHDIGQCAVLVGKEPLRGPDGKVIVFHSWVQANDRALDEFENADEEDRILWHEGDKRVSATDRIDIIFDPELNGPTKPFSLYLPEYRRPIYEDRTRPLMTARRGYVDPSLNAQAALDAKKNRAEHRQLDRQPSFEERPLRFRTIHGAIEEAERRERMLKGMPA